MDKDFAFKVNEMVCFTKDIFALGAIRSTQKPFIKAHEPVKLIRITSTSVTVERSDGKTKLLRNIPGRMYPNTKLGKLIYGK